MLSIVLVALGLLYLGAIGPALANNPAPIVLWWFFLAVAIFSIDRTRAFRSLNAWPAYQIQAIIEWSFAIVSIIAGFAVLAWWPFEGNLLKSPLEWFGFLVFILGFTSISILIFRECGHILESSEDWQSKKSLMDEYLIGLGNEIYSDD